MKSIIWKKSCKCRERFSDQYHQNHENSYRIFILEKPNRGGKIKSVKFDQNQYMPKFSYRKNLFKKMSQMNSKLAQNFHIENLLEK